MKFSTVFGLGPKFKYNKVAEGWEVRRSRGGKYSVVATLFIDETIWGGRSRLILLGPGYVLDNTEVLEVLTELTKLSPQLALNNITVDSDDMEPSVHRLVKILADKISEEELKVILDSDQDLSDAYDRSDP